MDEQRLDRMEDMLSKLITLVGNLNQQFQEMKNDMHELKSYMIDMKNYHLEMKNEQMQMRSDNEKQFTKIHKTLAEIRSDQDYIWEKAVRNEREIAKLKGQLQS
jgi:predicted  nucleic acid-binding Zn-ribbon protein